jgi:hypothetical protein
MAHIKESGPDSGLGFEVKVLNPLCKFGDEVVTFPSKSRRTKALSATVWPGGKSLKWTFFEGN